jgi:hypothetical protein
VGIAGHVAQQQRVFAQQLGTSLYQTGPALAEQLGRDDLLAKSRLVIDAANIKMQDMIGRLDAMQQQAGQVTSTAGTVDLHSQRGRIMRLQAEIDKYELASQQLLQKRESIRNLMREPLIETPR